MIRDFFQRRARDAEAAARLKALVREVMGLGEDAPVILAELRCHDPGCPEVEMVITVARPNGARVSLRPPKPLPEVAQADLEAQLALLAQMSATASGRPDEAP